MNKFVVFAAGIAIKAAMSVQNADIREISKSVEMSERRNNEKSVFNCVR